MNTLYVHIHVVFCLVVSCYYISLSLPSFCKIIILFINFISVPIPSLKVTLSRQCDLLAGSNLTLTCDISVDPNVDTPFDVNVSWNKTDQPVMSSGDTGKERCSSGIGNYNSSSRGSDAFNSSDSSDFNGSDTGGNYMVDGRGGHNVVAL